MKLHEYTTLILGNHNDENGENCSPKNICGFYENEVNSGDEENISSTGYCLVDFEEKQLYTLSDPYRGYFIRDYRIRYDIEPETEEGRRIQIDIVYVPIRDS